MARRSSHGKGVLPENALVAIARRPQPSAPPQPVLFGLVARRNAKELAADHPVVGLAFARGQEEEAARLLAALGRFPGCLEAEGYVLVQAREDWLPVQLDSPGSGLVSAICGECAAWCLR